MAVPNTTTFTLDDVRLEVDPTKNNLNDLITVANAQSPSEWDSDYAGSKNSLLNFRNYGAGPTFTAFQMQTQKSINEGAVDCFNTVFTTYYHNGANNEPTLFDNIYEDSAGTVSHDGRFFGSNGWRMCASGLTIAVNVGGQVTNTGNNCQF